MALSMKTRNKIIETLTEADQKKFTALESGLLLQECSHKKMVWEPYTGEFFDGLVCLTCKDGKIKQLPLTDFAGRELKFAYKKPKEKEE